MGAISSRRWAPSYFSETIFSGSRSLSGVITAIDLIVFRGRQAAVKQQETSKTSLKQETSTFVVLQIIVVLAVFGVILPMTLQPVIRGSSSSSITIIRPWVVLRMVHLFRLWTAAERSVGSLFKLLALTAYRAGSVPNIPLSVITLDGVRIQDESVINVTSGSNHTISALRSYTGVCEGVPCNGENITVYFRSWSACIFYPLNSSTSTPCVPFTISNPDNGPLIVTIPMTGSSGELVYFADYWKV